MANRGVILANMAKRKTDVSPGQLRLKYVRVFVDRHNKQRWYFRRPGQRQIALPGRPGSAGFMKAYQTCLDKLPPPQHSRAQQAIDRIDNVSTRSPRIGVYLLFLADELVYIGSSMNMPDRVATHRNNGRPFDHAYFIGTKVSERGKLERALIKAWGPSQNRSGVPGISDVAPPMLSPIEEYINRLGRKR